MAAHALLERNPNPTEEEIRHDLSSNLCMCTGYVQIVEAVKQAAARRAGMTTHAYIGTSAASKEAPRHVAGRGRFVDDMVLPRMLHACILRSPYAHARIRSVTGPVVTGPVSAESSRRRMSSACPVRSSPGRYAAGLRVPIPEYAGAVDKVRYVGEPLAMVAADTRAAAEDALELIEVDYEPLPAVGSPEAAVAADAPLIYEELGSNVAWEGQVSYGDVDAAFQRADRVVRENLRIHRYSSTPLEPFACLVEHTPERLTIWCNSQSPDVIYDAVTEALGIDNVRVIVPDIGGGFGQKIHLIRKYAVLTALMAVKTGRPVKWIEDRSEHMMAGGHSCEQEFDVEAAVSADGEVLGLKIADTDDVGGSISTLTIHFTNKLNNLFNTYKVQHLRLEGRSVVTNKCPVVPNRGIGKPGHVLRLGADDGPDRAGARPRSDRRAAPQSDHQRISFPIRRRTATSTAAAITRRCSTRRSPMSGMTTSAGAKRNLAWGEPCQARQANPAGFAPQKNRSWASASSSASNRAAGTRRATWRSFRNRSRCLGPAASKARPSSWKRTAPSSSGSDPRAVASRTRRRRRRSSPTCSASGPSGSRWRARSIPRSPPGACRPRTAGTTSISTTWAPSTARRHGFARRC